MPKRRFAMPNSLITIDPRNGSELNHYPLFSDQKIQNCLELSQKAFAAWRIHPLNERSRWVAQIGQQLLARKSELAKLCTQEMGKPLVQAEKEIEKCAKLCVYYSEKAQKFLQPQDVRTDYRESFIAFEPIGPVLCIMPWNFPYWQVMRFAVPALLAGNTVLLKHAANTTGCAFKIEEILSQSRVPDNFQTLLMDHQQTARVIASPVVRAVSLTGSEAAGKQVASLAGQHLKKTVLELGGSDAYIVLADANIEQASEACVQARMVNSGQSCVAAKRFIIESPVYDKFVEAFISKMRKAKIGDPFQSETTVGPLARLDLGEALQKQVDSSCAAGAEKLWQGDAPQQGAYFSPQVLGNVRPGMAAFDEETFGPVAAMIRASNTQEALELANQSRFGLGGAIFSQDLERAKNLAHTQMQSGLCAVNGMVVSDPRLPFGGIKDSGYGRELAEVGIHEFVNVKTVMVY